MSWTQSKGQETLTTIMQKLLPGEEIVSEEPIGERLRLDVYCPRYKLAAEYHGRQHFEFVQHFHGDLRGFKESQQRDKRKQEICAEKGISLVVFTYRDNLSEEAVFNRMMEALKEALPEPEDSESSSRYKGNPYYEKQQELRRKYWREQYQEMKRRRDDRA